MDNDIHDCQRQFMPLRPKLEVFERISAVKNDADPKHALQIHSNSCLPSHGPAAWQKYFEERRTRRQNLQRHSYIRRANISAALSRITSSYIFPSCPPAILPLTHATCVYHAPPSCTIFGLRRLEFRGQHRARNGEIRKQQEDRRPWGV